MPENNPDREQDALEAPAGLLSALKRSSKSSVFVPPTVDEAILRTARRQLSLQRESGFRRLLRVLGIVVTRRTSVGADVRRLKAKTFAGGSTPGQSLLTSAPTMLRWAAAAAAVVLLLVIVPRLVRKPGAGLAGDLNHDGQVDILDAFALARELKSGTHLGPQLDINGDGLVDERDVATLAARAVSLGKGGRS
jgi:hypothetical protein